MITEKNVEIRYENSGLVVTYEAGFLPEYQKKVLASGEIGCLLTMVFMNIEGKEVVTYDISGLETLTQHTFSSFNDMLEFLETVLTALSYADEYLIDIGNIHLETDYIFTDIPRNRIKLFYKPTKDLANWQLSFSRLITDINQTLQSRDIKKYLEILIDFIHENDRTIADLSLKISELKREAHMCGIR